MFESVRNFGRFEMDGDKITLPLDNESFCMEGLSWLWHIGEGFVYLWHVREPAIRSKGRYRRESRDAVDVTIFRILQKSYEKLTPSKARQMLEADDLWRDLVDKSSVRYI